MIAGESARIKHLLRRTAFGCRPKELEKWLALGEKGALERLLNYDVIPVHIPDLATDSLGALVAPADTDALKRYWLFRFCETTRPLEETMTLFWHWHFATSDFKVQNPSIEWRQNRLFRKHAMGNFREMLGELAVDPAMLMWLDGNNSNKKSPNENFSRELLELFTMGIDGGYTEQDVKEGAKAFTGWSYDTDRYTVKFESKNYNAQTKRYLGLAGNFDLNQTLNIVARHPSTARFLSKKLFEFFVFDDPPAEEIDRLAKIYLESKFSIHELVKGVLTSPHFYSNKALYAQIKCPVQFAVMTAKTLDVPNVWIGDMQSYTDNMGQQLLNPPNVKGWKTGRNWINTNTITARLNFTKHAVDSIRYRGLMKDRISEAFAVLKVDPIKAFSAPESAVDEVWSWLLPSAIMPDETRKGLVAYMESDAPKKPNKDYYWYRAAGLVELVMSCPEYQLA